MDAYEKQEFLTKIAHECSREVVYSIDNAMKLLFGDFSDRSMRAKV